MRELEEINKLESNKNRCEEFIKRIKSLALVGSYGSKEVLAITENHNGRFTIGKIEDVIGTEKLYAAISSFENQITAELYKEKESIESELSKYKITKEK